jgi:CheY-like chemotaxis protein
MRGAGSGEAPAKKRILLVDDDEVFREATGAVLQAAGYEVRMAPDFRLALEILESDVTVDLFLVDIVMPDRVNGLALARMARLRRPEIKVLYLSGYDIPGVKTEALGPIIAKPVSDELLVERVSSALHDSSPRSSGKRCP